MKIGLVQYSPLWEDKNSNQLMITHLLEKADQMDLVILPELTLIGFTMNSQKFSESIDGESFMYFSQLAREMKFDLVAGLIEKDGAKYFNALVHIDASGKLISKYRKIHPFTYSTEDKFYERGNETVITNINGWSTGLSICYDLRFPELYRLYGKQRTDLIINIANWPDTRIEHWRTLLKARAIENQCYVAGVNRVGDDPKLHYTGYSSVFDPMGVEVISLADDEKVIVTDINIDQVNEVRKRLPFLNDIKLI